MLSLWTAGKSGEHTARFRVERTIWIQSVNSVRLKQPGFCFAAKRQSSLRGLLQFPREVVS
jgi:hypothetical protein